MIKNNTNYAKSYQPNKKQGDVLSIAASWSANLSSHRNTTEQLILPCLHSLWGSFPNLEHIFVRRGGLVAEQTNHAQKGTFPQVQIHQKLSCQAQQTAQMLHNGCSAPRYVTLWFSTHSYYAKHSFPRSVAGAKGKLHSVRVFQQLVRGLHVAIPEQAH